MSSDGLTVRTPSMRELDGSKAAYAAQTLGLLAKNSNDAAQGAGGLKDKLHDMREHLNTLEHRLDRVSKAASAAHDALDSLKSAKADLVSGVQSSLEHDPFAIQTSSTGVGVANPLAAFNAQVTSDTADAQAVLAALQTLVANGLDPHSDLFKRLAASGNVPLIKQFAALTSSQLAAEVATFQAGQTALSAVGQFAGDSAFNDLIKAQTKVTDKLDGTVHELAQEVKHLQHAIDDMANKVEKASHEGTKKGSTEGGREAGRYMAAGVNSAAVRGLRNRRR